MNIGFRVCELMMSRRYALEPTLVWEIKLSLLYLCFGSKETYLQDVFPPSFLNAILLIISLKTDMNV